MKTLKGMLRIQSVLLVLAATASPALAQATMRVSLHPSGSQAALGAGQITSVTNDGRVAFESLEPFDGRDTNGVSDVYLYDRSLGTTTLLSVNAAGTAAGNGVSTDPEITPSGAFVVFASVASDLVSGDSNGVSDVFVVAVATGAMTMMSRGPSGAPGNGASTEPSISNTGRIVAFTS